MAIKESRRDLGRESRWAGRPSRNRPPAPGRPSRYRRGAAGPRIRSHVRFPAVGKQLKTFEFPGHLIKAQRALETVQAERRARLAVLPGWSGLEAAREGLAEEGLAESARLEEAER